MAQGGTRSKSRTLLKSTILFFRLLQISYQAGYHLTASDARLHARTQNLEHLKIFFFGGGWGGGLGL